MARVSQPSCRRAASRRMQVSAPTAGEQGARNLPILVPPVRTKLGGRSAGGGGPDSDGARLACEQEEMS